MCKTTHVQKGQYCIVPYKIISKVLNQVTTIFTFKCVFTSSVITITLSTLVNMFLLIPQVHTMIRM